MGTCLLLSARDHVATAKLQEAGWALVRRCDEADVIVAIDVDFQAILEDSPHASVVYVSERSDLDRQGADLYLIRPDPEELLAAMKRVRDRTRIRRAAQERLQDVLDCVREAFFALARDNRVTYQNRRARELMAQLHETSGEIIGESFLEQLPGDLDVRVKPAIAECLRTAEPSHLEAYLDSLNAWVEVRIHPVPDGTAIFIREISERKRADEALVEMQRALAQQEKLASLGGLVAGVAHEVRTPITYLANEQYMIRRLLEAGAERGQTAAEVLAQCLVHLDACGEGIARVSRIVKELERFTRLEVGVTTRFRLDVAAAGALRLFTVTNKSGVRITMELDETPLLRGDENQVQQVILNLLQNAVEATPPGREGIHIATRRTPEGLAELVVQDHGDGMTDDVRKRAHDPLFTTKVNGSGLGLAIVARILGQHHATTHIDTAPGKGTRYAVQFSPAGSP